MAQPGSGRYTDYVPRTDDTPNGGSKGRFDNRYVLFNARHAKGDFVGTATAAYKDNDTAAIEFLKRATAISVGLLPSDGAQKGDIGMFGAGGVNLNYEKHPSFPNIGVDPLKAVSATGGAVATKPDMPWTPYVPNISSPNAEGDKFTPGAADLKNYIYDNNKDSDPTSPAATAGKMFTLGDALKLGSSQKL